MKPDGERQLDVYPHHGRVLERLRGRRRLLHAVIPRHTWKPLIWELRMAWLRLRSLRLARRFAGRRDLLVNIGAGRSAREGWVNLDAVRRPGVDCACDVRRRLPLPDASVLGIFCEHFLEHLDYTEEVPGFLVECHRVLAPGGILRIVVPDGRRLLEAYAAAGWSDLDALLGLDGEHRDPQLGGQYHTKLEALNVAFRQGHQHRWMYDFEGLDFVLRRYGFAEVVQQSFGKSRSRELCVDDPERAPASLYVEAIRP